MEIANIPRITDGAINFLEDFFEQRAEPDLRVLEFGSGASTLWFCHRTVNLVSIEHDPEWFSLVRAAAALSVDLRLLPLPYHQVCDEFPDGCFDLVLVDGLDIDEGRMRLACVESAIRLLPAGGILMFDNAQVPEYAPIYDILSGWAMTETIQRESRPSYRAGNKTNWWIKP